MSRKKKRAKKTPVARAKAKPAEARPASPHSWRKRLLLAGTAMAIPVLLFVLLELGLRIGGYGYPAGYFIKSRVNGQDAYIDNLRFRHRFFPRGLERATHPAVVSAEKGEGTYRIFILGASAAMGDPEPGFGFGRILEVMLRLCYPATRFEVANTAMAAINSHVVLPIARDCAKHEPDLFIVYLGNNEVVGPFGAGTILQGFGPNLKLIRVNILAKATRTGQLADSIVQRLTQARERPRTWRGMEMFVESQVRAGDPRLEAVYAHFARNIEDICDAGLDVGAKVALCTVGTNLRDCPPFASMHRPDLSDAQRDQWDMLYREGIAREATSAYPAAIQCYQEAASVDDGYAELHFRLGRCYFAAGDEETARRHYRQARDLDTLRFRADTRINEAIRAVAAALSAQGVVLVDVEEAFQSHSPHGVPGGDLFHEHVHMTFEGNYVLARTLFDHIAPLLPESIRSNRTGEAPSRDECARRLALTGWDRHKQVRHIITMLSKPPFTNQLDNEQRLEGLRRSLGGLRSYTSPIGLQAAAAAHRRALDEGGGEDWRIRADLAQILMQLGLAERAEEHLRAAIRQVPHNLELLVHMAQVLSAQGKVDEAIAHCRQVEAMYPEYPIVHNNLGIVLKKKGDLGGAIESFRKAIGLNPGSPAPHFNLGLALARIGNLDGAAAQYRETIECDPTHLKAHLQLGKALVRKRDYDGALDVLRDAEKLSPDDPAVHDNLGNVFGLKGDLDEAIAAYRKAVAIDPDFSPAYKNLAAAFWQKRDYDAAWAAVERCRRAGGTVPSELLEHLARDSGRHEDGM